MYVPPPVTSLFCIDLLFNLDDFRGLYLFAGPHTILRCHEECTEDYLPWKYLDDDGPYTKFLTTPLQQILQQRRYDLRLSDLNTILDSINGNHEKCQ